jgi:hypothetical protein
MSLRKRRFIWVAGVAVALAALAGGFLAGRAIFDDGPATGAPPGPPSSAAEVTPLPTPSPGDEIDTSRPGWALAYLEADKLLPRYDQVINGIIVGPTAPGGESGLCQPGEARWVRLEEAQRLDPAMARVPTRLPAGAILDRVMGIACGEHLISMEFTIVIPSAPDGARQMAQGRSWFDVEHGGQLIVSRDRTKEPARSSTIAAERWEAATVAGLPAAIGRAVLRDELWESMVVVWDASRNLQVTVRGFDRKLPELLALAEEAVQ